MTPARSVLGTSVPRRMAILCGHGAADQYFLWCPIIFLLFALWGCGDATESRASQTSALLAAEPELTERSENQVRLKRGMPADARQQTFPARCGKN